MNYAEFIWEDFISTISNRITIIQRTLPQYVLSEETFRLDYALALTKIAKLECAVFAEFPCDKNPKQKWDLFITQEPGTAIEIKFLRPIPSGINPPFTQHFGAVIADVLKLLAFANQDRVRHLILITDLLFKNYLTNQGFPIGAMGLKVTKVFNPSTLQITARNEIKKRLGTIFDLNSVQATLTIVKNSHIGTLEFNLYRISH